LTNLLAALREGDYSLRARAARQVDSMGEVMREVNALGDQLLVERRQAIEASALLKAVIAAVEIAVFTFDEKGKLRLMNPAGANLLMRREEHALGYDAVELGLDDCLVGDPVRLIDRDFPGRSGTRWGLRRTTFREGGRPHQLLVLTDLGRALREEERIAWQRLIRVLGHPNPGGAPELMGKRSSRRDGNYSGPGFSIRSFYDRLCPVGSATAADIATG
jgi:two-component system, NtrC family, nitrogen regulation sensor histidine kinase NtrY